MSMPKNFLHIVVRCTLTLLFIASFLIVLGIFNASLRWDIFGPKMEAVLLAVFWSCVVLSGCGVAITLVVGIQEISSSISVLTGQMDRRRKISPRAAIIWIFAVLIITSGILGGLAFVNHRVQMHRTSVFKKVALENTEALRPRIAAAVENNRESETAGDDLCAVLQALEGLSFVRQVTVYLPDQRDSVMLKKFNPSTLYKKDRSFDFILAARDYEKAILSALSGNPDELDRLNGQTLFTYYLIVYNGDQTPVAVLKVDGNSRENFREYRCGS